ncbi:MAG: MFS transporter [Candidatus Harrisonbacteria bacterium]|nr:MFS transporter [Candidatus Harrisonbacteria bacterium]
MLFKISSISIPKINRVIRYFIIGDLIMWAGWGFIDPIFSIFVIRNITSASLTSIGLLATIYWVTKGILQIPISLFLDKTDGEKDDFYAMIFGLMIMSVAAFSFMVAGTMNQIYFVQFLKAIGFALYIPSWSAIATRHLDKENTAFEWAASSSAVSLAAGAAGFFGGVIANFAGFNFVFLTVGLLALFSAALLLVVPDLILPRQTVAPLLPPMKIKDPSQMGMK